MEKRPTKKENLYYASDLSKCVLHVVCGVWCVWCVLLRFSPGLPALWTAAFLKAAAANPWGYSVVFLGLSVFHENF